jgi:hypothetical protein
MRKRGAGLYQQKGDRETGRKTHPFRKYSIENNQCVKRDGSIQACLQFTPSWGIYMYSRIILILSTYQFI